MINQNSIDIELPVPDKRCRFCQGENPPLEHDVVVGWFHPACLNKHIEHEALFGIKEAKIPFNKLKNKTK